MDYQEELAQYQPTCVQEDKDKEIFLQYFDLFKDKILTRQCTLAHLTGSSMILNKEHTHVLMAFHNIYQSWSWTGGHADGERDMLKLAIKEAKEETGILNVRPLKAGLVAIDVLPVWGHIKNHEYISSHMHLNYSYLLEADDQQEIHKKADENSGVMWIKIEELDAYVREEGMRPVYHKILKQLDVEK